jgi:RNA-directed DNA polymerase
MSDAKEFRLEAVSERTRRARETLTRWGWVEPTVWTERMLTALIEGVKGGAWYSLMDKVHPQRVLRAAYSRVAANEGAAGVDHVTVTMFESRLEENLTDLSDALRTGTYRPQAIRRHYIPKPGSQERRPLGIPICRSYCTSFQMGWGLSDGGPVPPSALVSFLRPIAATTSDASACAGGRSSPASA